MSDPIKPDHILVDDYITTLKQRIAELEKVLREIDQDPSQEILTDAQRKLLEKGTGE